MTKTAFNSKLFILTSTGTDTEESNRIAYTKKRELAKQARGKPLKGSKEWIMKKKDRRRRQGKEVREDSRYTGRRRSGKF